MESMCWTKLPLDFGPYVDSDNYNTSNSASGGTLSDYRQHLRSPSGSAGTLGNDFRCRYFLNLQKTCYPINIDTCKTDTKLRK